MLPKRKSTSVAFPDSDDLDPKDTTDSHQVELAIISNLIEHFNERMFAGSLEDSEEISFLKTQLLKLVQSEPSPALTLKFLNLIKILNRQNLQRVGIEFIPKICGNSEEENTKIIDLLDGIFKSENNLTQIVISTLYRLENLTSSQQEKILFIAQNALESVEEDDLDDIVKIMLKNVTRKNSAQVVQYIREKLSNDDAASVRISSELLADSFSTTPSMANYFLKSLKAEQEEFSKLDILILMILLSTRHRERSSTFSIFKNAFLNKPKRLVNIATILDTLRAVGSILHDSKYVERIYNSIYIFIIYLLSNSEIFTDEKGVPWVYSIFIHSFKTFQPLRSKFLTSLLALFQYNDPKSNIAADILIGLCNFEQLDEEYEESVNLCKQISMNHLSIIKDSLAHAVTYSVRCQHSLCYALAKISIYEPKTFEYLMIFIRKQLFSGQDKKSQLGLIISMHLIHETQYMISSDIDRFVFALFNTKNLDENSIHILDLFIYNFEILQNMGFSQRMKAIIAQLLKQLDIVDTFPEISPQSNFQFRKFCSINLTTPTSLKTLSMLIKCYILCHENDKQMQNIGMAFMQLGAKGLSKEELLCIYAIGYVLYDHVIEKNNSIDNLDQEDQASLVDYTEYLLQLRLDIASAEPISNIDIDLDTIFKLFPLSVEIISLFIRKYKHEYEEISMMKEREAFKCLWTEFDFMLKHLLMFKSDMDESEEENNGADKGKGIYVPDFNILSPKRLFFFGSLLLEGKKSPSSIYRFVDTNKKVIGVLVKKSYKFAERLTEKRSNMKMNEDTQALEGRDIVDHLVLCLSYIYCSLTNVFFVTRNISENAFDELISSFKTNDSSISTNAVYLVRLILKQVEDASYFVHAIQLTLLLVSICQGKELQKIIGYVSVDLLTRVFSSTPLSADIEKIAMDSYVFKELPFYHLLNHRETAVKRKNPSISKYLNQSTLLFALTYLPAEEGRTLVDFFVLGLDDFLHAMKEEQDLYIQHHPLNILDENTFHFFLQIITKVFEMSIINAPCTPVNNGGNRNFIRIEDPLDNIRKVILIYMSFQQSEFLRNRRKDSGEVLVQSCLAIAPIIQTKLDECVRYITDKTDEIDFEMSRTAYYTLFDRVKCFCDVCFALCDEQKQFSNPDSKSDGKLRQEMLKLFQLQYNLEVYLRDLCKTNHFEYFDGNEIESDAFKSWNCTPRYRKGLEEKFTDLNTNNVWSEIFEKDFDISQLWDSAPIETFFDSYILFVNELANFVDVSDIEEDISSEDEQETIGAPISLEEALQKLKKRKAIEDEPTSEPHILHPRKKHK